MISKIIITGGTGFLGKSLVNELSKYFKLLLIGRSSHENRSFPFYQATINRYTDLTSIFSNESVVIHCAARVHVMNDSKIDSLELYREVNTYGTLNLARQAASKGVKRFIFLSSVKVNGECTTGKPAFFSEASCSPVDPYGVSKWEAEQGLLQIAAETGMEVVIIRPPLVYGPRVKANFAAFMKLASKNLPLPFGSIQNKRSLVGVHNLVDLIRVCIDHSAAANQTFLVSDDHDVSTTELLEALTRAAGKEPRLWPFPTKLLELGLKTIGKGAIADRLFGNLQVDITHTKETLGWKPPMSFEEGIRRCFATD